MEMITDQNQAESLFSHLSTRLRCEKSYEELLIPSYPAPFEVWESGREENLKLCVSREPHVTTLLVLEMNEEEVEIVLEIYDGRRGPYDQRYRYPEEIQLTIHNLQARFFRTFTPFELQADLHRSNRSRVVWYERNRKKIPSVERTSRLAIA